LSHTPRPALDVDEADSPASSTPPDLGALEEYILRTQKGQDGFERHLYRQEQNRRRLQKIREKAERQQEETENAARAKNVAPRQDEGNPIPPRCDEDAGSSRDTASLNDDDNMQAGEEGMQSGTEINALVDELLGEAGNNATGDSQDDDASDFITQEEARRKKKEKRRSRGTEVSDTDEEDIEAEDEMLEDVVPELDSPGHQAASRSPAQKRRWTAKEKGKARLVDSQSEHGGKDDGEGSCDEGDECSTAARRTPGPLSAEARLEAQQLGEQVQQAVSTLAKKYNKPYHSILVAAGLNIQSARRQQNFSNQFKMWYSATHPKEDGSKHHLALFCCRH
jgi:hypothetical protein